MAEVFWTVLWSQRDAGLVRDVLGIIQWSLLFEPALLDDLKCAALSFQGLVLPQGASDSVRGLQRSLGLFMKAGLEVASIKVGTKGILEREAQIPLLDAPEIKIQGTSKCSKTAPDILLPELENLPCISCLIPRITVCIWITMQRSFSVKPTQPATE